LSSLFQQNGTRMKRIGRIGTDLGRYRQIRFIRFIRSIRNLFFFENGVGFDGWRPVILDCSAVMNELKHSDVTGAILKAFYRVYNELGHGFLEKVYENAIAFELIDAGMTVQTQRPIAVFYRGQLVGEYFADLVVNDCVIVELKAAESLSRAHEAQLINYLRATEFEVGLLLNFGTSPEHKRKIFDVGKSEERWKHLLENTEPNLP
jgi:GxxExxY protein